MLNKVPVTNLCNVENLKIFIFHFEFNCKYWFIAGIRTTLKSSEDSEMLLRVAADRTRGVACSGWSCYISPFFGT